MTCLGKIEICSGIRGPSQERFVPRIKLGPLGPGDVYNLQFGGSFKENVKK